MLEFDWPGTFDPSPILCIPHALAFLGAAEGGVVGVRQRNRAMAFGAQAALVAALGLPRAPCPPSMVGALAAVPLPVAASPDVPPRKGISLDPLQIALGEKYRIEVPVFPLAAGSARLLRISAHLYNRATDYERLIEALRAEEIALADG